MEQIGLRKYSKHWCLDFNIIFKWVFYRVLRKSTFKSHCTVSQILQDLVATHIPNSALWLHAAFVIIGRTDSWAPIHISMHVTYIRALILFCVVLRPIKIEKISLHFTYTYSFSSAHFLLQRCFKPIIFFFFLNNFIQHLYFLQDRSVYLLTTNPLMCIWESLCCFPFSFEYSLFKRLWLWVWVWFDLE